MISELNTFRDSQEGLHMLWLVLTHIFRILQGDETLPWYFVPFSFQKKHENNHLSITQITLTSVALWTDEKFLNQAKAELNCDWKIFSLNQGPSITAYLIVMHIDYHIFFHCSLNTFANF